ncbi:MAG: hypothetical protein ACE5G7_07520 [Candidatus Hydrothermarchaeaceae archaeon]
MKLLAVLAESLRLMRVEPKIYIPRVVTTLIYTVFILYTARLSLRITNAVLLAQARAAALGTLPDFSAVFAQLAGSLATFAVFFLFAYAIDILSYGMYVRIVSDYHANRPIEIIQALRDVLGRVRTLVVLSLVILAFIAGIFFLYLLLGSAFLLTQRALFSMFALLVLLVGLVAFVLIFFFSIPVAMLEDKGVLNAISTSAKLGFKHKGIVIKINLVFAGLILATLVVAMYTNFSGRTGVLAVGAFVVARLLQALVYTYISIVNPDLYLHLEEAH